MLPTPPHLKPDYGIDAPGVVRNFALLGTGLVLIAVLCWWLRDSFAPLSYSLTHMAFWPGLTFLATALAMLYGSKVGKLHFRDRLIQALNLQGHERVLDIGCGRGLMVLGVAKNLTTG